MDFEKIKESLEKTKDIVVAKSIDAAKYAKLKVAITTEETKLKKLYAKIGALMHEIRTKGVNNDEEIASVLDECDTVKEKIEELEAELDNSEGLKCENCGKINEEDSVFCNNCGEKLTIKDEE